MSTGSPVISKIERRASYAGILKLEQPFASGDGQGTAEAVNGWFDRLMMQSGIQTAPTVWMMLSVVLAAGLAGLAFVASEHVPFSVLAAVVGGAVPIVIALVRRSTRQKKILNQLPLAADQLSRMARSGLNLEACLRNVAADTEAPLGDELRRIVRRNDLGLDLGSAIKDLPERTGVDAVTPFTAAISVNQETGGDLISVMERLASSVRDRIAFVRRLHAATIASKCAAVLMLVVPPLILIVYPIIHPDYLRNLFASSAGAASFWTGLSLLTLGILVILTILRRTSRF